jgi:hypothetical protein
MPISYLVCTYLAGLISGWGQYIESISIYLRNPKNSQISIAFRRWGDGYQPNGAVRENARK